MTQRAIENNPYQRRAKLLADAIYDGARKIAKYIAPEEPIDAEYYDDEYVWRLLETAAQHTSPAFWDDPDAITDLFNLRKQFTGREDQFLPIFAKAAKDRQSHTLNLDIPPGSKEWDEQDRRIHRP